MKSNFVLLSIILISGTLLIFCSQNTESKFSELKGSYLGQKPPGMKAEIFAPGLISAGAQELNITFSPDGKEVSFTVITPGETYYPEQMGVFKRWFMMYSRLENGHWTEPVEFSFNPDRDERYPFFSPDGKKLFFNSYRNYLLHPYLAGCFSR